jgi:small subunit ribosomal protein S1
MTEEFESQDRQGQAQQRQTDQELEKEIQDALGGQSLDEILQAEETQSQASPAKPSGVRQGRVIGIHGDDIFVYFGGKTQGLLQAGQFEDEELPSEGDLVEVTVEGIDNDDGLLILSRKGAVMEATWDSIRPGAVVEGRVTGLNKGGLELNVDGIRAFLPASQVEIGHVEDLSGYLNERLQVEVQEVDRQDNNVVVSRRRLLEAQAAEMKEELLKKLEVGQVVTGKVKTLKPYGAFVDIGGVDGLLHISDMSHTHIDKPEDVCQVGDDVEVKVLKIEEDGERISLGLKQTQADPWKGAQEKWTQGQVVGGRVTRLADFGAFVEIEPGVEGLIPISEFTYGRRIGHAKEVLSQGDAVQVKVLNVDERRKRLSLSLKQMQEDPWMGASARWPAQSIVEGRVTRTTDFGAFVEVTDGVEGLIHISQLSDSHVQNVSQVVREGDQVKAAVLSVDEDARRMSLSIKALSQSAQNAQPRNYDTPSKPRKRKRPLKGGLD